MVDINGLRCHNITLSKFSLPYYEMHLCCFSLITSEKFRPTSRYSYQLVEEVMNITSISIAFNVDTLIRNENVISEERKTKKRLKQSCMWSKLRALNIKW